jgi:outer membrane protein OmpA-like peptidoglycan-associated protein
MLLTLIALLVCGAAFAAGEADVNIRTTKAGADVKVEQVIKDGKLLVSVTDAAKEPLLGLSISDFSVTQSGRTAKITSVQPMSENKDVPRHIVMVMDNSYSMYERKAIKALLEGVSELLKTVRPIDDVRMVVFENNKAVRIGGRDLHVQTFASNQPADLQDFATKAYQLKGLTGGTVLYEALLAGIDMISTMPVGEPRFMVVFSDGEDLNSSYTENDVFKTAQSLERFNAYAIDYLARPETDKILTKFARDNSGQIWKATSESNLVPIFQSVASKMQYHYVVSYQFPPTGNLAVAPSGLTIEEIRSADAALPTKIDTSALTLRPVVDSVYGIARWKAVVSNATGNIAELTGEGAPAAELKLQLPTADLMALAANGSLSVKMELEDRMGQNLTLTGAPVAVNRVQVRAGLSAAPAILTVDEVRSMGAAAVATINSSALTLRPTFDSSDWIARWKAIVSNSMGTVAELAGEGAPTAELKLALPAANLQGLAANGDLAVKLVLENRMGQSLALNAAPVKVMLVQTRASLAVTPASLKIEEIKTIDSSPMLGHIYFEKGAGEIQPQYIRFNGAGETAGFDEQKFSGTLEKYYQDLNIIGKRLADKPEASIKLIGCNDNNAREKGNKKLSAQRAEAVKEYLKTVWNIAPERMPVETRNLPAKPSSAQLKEGQAENRRVEIVSADPSILAPIRSTYFTTRIDTPALTVKPDVVAPNGIVSWKITASNGSGVLADLSGKGTPAPETLIQLGSKDLVAVGKGGDIAVKMELRDGKGHSMSLAPEPVKVSFLHTSQRLAQKQDTRVQEKYALILFDFNKDTIEAQNQEIINTIVARIKTLPQATVEIVGHTDNIGSEKYNLKLSERRALSVYKMLAASYGEAPGDRIRYSGVGPNNPLFDNLTPEARSFNRTVTITLEYVSKE